MWLSRRRAKLESLLVAVVLLLGGGVAAASLVTGDIKWGLMALSGSALWLLSLRWLVRCERCGKGPLWWGLKNTQALSVAAPLRGVTACPYCGHYRDEHTLYD